MRINGSDIRARVVGEGGNLGCTQLGRIEYALGGGRINTDFIDNSAGVDTSDHEVNWKILLGLAVSAERAHAGGAQRAAAVVRARRRRARPVRQLPAGADPLAGARLLRGAHRRVRGSDAAARRGQRARSRGRVPAQLRGDDGAARERSGHGASRARGAPGVRETFDRGRAHRVRPSGLRVPRAVRPPSVLPAGDRRAVRSSDPRAPVEAGADRDDRVERRRELRRHHVRLPDGDGDRLASRRRRARLSDRSRRHGCRRALGSDRGARRRHRPARASPADARCRLPGRDRVSLVPRTDARRTAVRGDRRSARVVRRVVVVDLADRPGAVAGRARARGATVDRRGRPRGDRATARVPGRAGPRARHHRRGTRDELGGAAGRARVLRGGRARRVSTGSSTAWNRCRSARTGSDGRPSRWRTTCSWSGVSWWRR